MVRKRMRPVIAVPVSTLKRLGGIAHDLKLELDRAPGSGLIGARALADAIDRTINSALRNGTPR